MASQPTPATRAGAQRRLLAEYANLKKENWIHLDDKALEQNIFKWQFALCVINSDSVFNGGYLRAEMKFMDDYPYSPPTFKFLSPVVFHPNVYKDGHLCISILHTPGEDSTSGESASERWSPLQGVESVLRSVLLLLDDPEINSPANVDASVMYRDAKAQYAQKAAEVVASSREAMPSDFKMPATFDPPPPPKKEEEKFNFWEPSDDDDDFDFDSDSEDDDDGESGAQDGLTDEADED